MKVLNRLVISGILLLAGLLLLSAPQAGARELAQQPTVSIPTVTGTPRGPVIRVNADYDFIRVRSGPSTVGYPEIGVLISGEIVSALGKTADGEWIQIVYPGVEGGVGWVYSRLVTATDGEDIQIVDAPATATPRVTPQIDPTLAAEYIEAVPPTRPPTYTPPPPLVVSTFEPNDPTSGGIGFPVGLVIVLLGAVGILGALFALIRGR